MGCSLPRSGRPQEKPKAGNICDVAGKVQPVTPDQRGAIERYLERHPYYAPNTNARYATAFANGWGVKPDLKRATAYACHANTVPAELMAQVEALQKHSFTAKTPFIACNYVTSGINGSFCVVFAADLADRAREKQIAAATAGYNAAQKRAFADLRKAATAYFEAHARLEQDLTGTARGEFVAGTETVKKKQFLVDITGFEAGNLPLPHVGFAKVDAGLNAQYRKIMRHTFDPEAMPGSVTKDGIRKTERAWITYRNAWLRFAKVRHPITSQNALKAWLAQQRTHELSKLVAEELP